MGGNLVFINALLCCLILTAFLWVFSVKGRKISFFSPLSGCYFFYIISICTDITWILIDGIPKFRTLSYTVNTIEFISIALISYCWFLYCRDLIFCPCCKSKTGKVIAILPVLIVAAFSMLSIYNGCLFSISADGIYHRGPLFFMQQIGYIYFPFISILALVSYSRTIRVDQKRQFVVLAGCSMAPVFLGAIQIIMPPAQLPTLHFSFILAFILMYLNEQDQRITYDTLTSLLNRFGFIKMLEDNLVSYKKKKNPSNNLYMLVGDVDHFKMINDTYGHLEGDHALQIVAATLSEVALHYGAIVGHISGDEFAILMYAPTIDLPEKYRTAVQEELQSHCKEKPYSLSISLGISKYDGEMSYIDFINIADLEMYTVKKSK